jgi:hypothetical protein
MSDNEHVVFMVPCTWCNTHVEVAGTETCILGKAHAGGVYVFNCPSCGRTITNECCEHQAQALVGAGAMVVEVSELPAVSVSDITEGDVARFIQQLDHL